MRKRDPVSDGWLRMTGGRRPIAMRAAVLACCAVMFGCADVRRDRAADTDTLSATASASPGAPEVDTSALDDSSRSADADTLASAAHLAVEGEGLRVFFEPSGSARPVPFGVAKPDALSILTRVLGAPREEGFIEDCAVSYAAWMNGLTAYFSRDRFAGWSLGRESELTTASGLGIGSTRADLDSAYSAEVGETSVGIEFTAGGIAGVLESEGQGARVLHLWAGVACIAR